MKDFDIIESGFNNADETINFGTRSIGYDSLYEISTLACLKCSEDNSGVAEVFINSSIKNGRVFLSINKSIKIFEDTELSTIIFNAVFDSIIDAMSVSINAKFLLICLRSGKILVFDIENPLNINCVFTTCLVKSDSLDKILFVGSFSEHCNDKFVSFLVVSNEGKVDRICIILKESEDDTTININVNFEEIYRFEAIVNTTSFSYPNLLVNGVNTNILNVENNMVMTDFGYKLKAICPLGHKFLGLYEDGSLVRICSSTLIIFPVENTEMLYDEMLVVDDCNGKKQVVAVTKRNEAGVSFLQLLNTDFSPIFSLKLSNPVHLVQMENTSDETLVMSKICNEKLITELRFQCVYETEPELRLTRLIRKQRFEEAEKFAKTFNINPIIILKARAQIIVDKTGCTPDDVVNLINLLNSIDDDYFKLQCCSNVECSRYDDVKKILNYGSTIIPKSHCENKEGVILLQRVLMDMLYKFDTYMAVYNNYDIQTWSKFSECDLIDELMILLKNFQVEEAIIVCCRLDMATIDELTEGKIEEILLILNNLPTSIYLPFLPTFIPVSMLHRPSALSIFVKWLRNKIFHLEKKDSYNFPENGINFAENILGLLKVEESSCMFFQRQCTLNKEELNELALLMDALKGIQLLKKNFRINISLSEYLLGPKVIIRTLLNIVMDAEEYDYFLKEFLYKFMIQNQFDPDEIFLDEIKNLIKYDEDYWVQIVEAILKYISSVKIKLEAIKEILENACVPWCDIIRNIGKGALQYSHPLVFDIKDLFENEPILVVLRNPKYKIKEKQITTISELQYVVKRIVYINEPSMKNDVYQLCKSTSDRHEVNIILIQHFVKNGNFEEAMKILDDNTNEEIYLSAKWIFSYAEIAINNKIRLYKQRDNYYKILGSLFRRLHGNAISSMERKCFEDDLQLMRGVYNINQLYKRNITTDEIRSSENKNKLLEELLEEGTSNYERGSLCIENILNQVDKMAAYLLLDKERVLLKFCEKVECFDVILKVAKHLYNSESSSTSLCLIAVLLLKYMGLYRMALNGSSLSDSSNSPILSTNSSDDYLYSDLNSESNILLGFNLCEMIITKALINAKADDICAIVEVMNWVNSCFYLPRCKENSIETELFKHIYHSEHNSPGYSSFAAVRNIFQIYCSYANKSKDPSTKYLTYFNNCNITLFNEEQLLKEIIHLQDTIDILCREGQHLTAYKLLVTLQNSLKCSTLPSGVEKKLGSLITKKCIPQVLHVVVSATHIDLILFENLLLASGKDYHKYVEHYLKLYKRHPRKLNDIANVGIKLLKFHKVTSGREELVNAVFTCKWWNKLKTKSCSIPYDDFFKMRSDIRLKQLISLEIIDVKLIKEYCEEYKLDVQTYYMDYLKSVLVNWKPDYECKTELNGRTVLVVKNDENILHSKCQEVLNVITEKEAAFTLMNKIWDVVNFYHYEVFICILKILSNNNKIESSRNLDLPMLLFLKNYQRFSVPSQNEKEQWYSTFPDVQILDPLSKFRLPFIKMLFTFDIWNIIRPEINLKSYKCWFDALNILRKNLKMDDICSFAVKEVVSSGVMDEDMTRSWTLYPKFEDLFAEIDKCVQNISDLEIATSVVYHLMNHTPNGADKVNAAQLSYKYARKYKEKNPNSADVERAYVKVKLRYYSFSAMHILHMFQLAEEKYLQLVAQPEDLVRALYLDERILKQAESINLSCPDINNAVDALGKLFDIKVEQIRYNLLNLWLTSTTADIDFDSTEVLPVDILTSQSNNDDNLKRATYICTSGSKSFWQTYLLKVGMEDETEDSDQHSLSFKAKALKCFCAISDINVITQLTGVTYKEFLNYIDKLSLLSELECLGIALNIESLDQYNKKELLKRLSQISKPVAIKVMATICITYFIEDIRYWEFIINSSIKLGMFTELKGYVDFLKNKCYKGFYINAWQVIIDNAFNVPSVISEEELFKTFINNFLMIQSCPVLYSLNFEKIIQKCIKHEKFQFAAILLQYLSDDKKEIYVNKIVRNRTLLLDLDILTKNGIWGVRNIKSWLISQGYSYRE